MSVTNERSSSIVVAGESETAESETAQDKMRSSSSRVALDTWMDQASALIDEQFSAKSSASGRPVRNEATAAVRQKGGKDASISPVVAGILDRVRGQSPRT